MISGGNVDGQRWMLWPFKEATLERGMEADRKMKGCLSIYIKEMLGTKGVKM